MCTYSWRVPPTGAGDVRIATSWNLGGLGATQGPPLTYHCAAPNLMPDLLPWLALLALLALKPNRCGPAWWIWLPLTCLLAGLHCLQLGFHQRAPGFPNEALIATFSVPCALGFGLAATWLLAPYLARSRRFRTSLCLLPTLALFSAFSYAAPANWEGEAGETAMKLLALLVLVTLVLAAAILCCGWICRGRYGPLRLCLALFVSLLVVCFAVLSPLAVGEMLTTRGGGELSGLFVCWLFGAAGSFVVLLPFVVLSAANSLFRERIKALCHLECKPAQTMAPTPSA